jgi:hypothetical protein
MELGRTMLLQQQRDAARNRRVLAAVVRMMDGVRGAALLDRHLQSGEDERGPQSCAMETRGALHKRDNI